MFLSTSSTLFITTSHALKGPSPIELRAIQLASNIRRHFEKDPTFPPILSKKETLKISLSYPQSFFTERSNGTMKRGFCNWLLPNYLMIGQYPGQTPEGSPSEEEARRHMQCMISDAHIRTFVCLQSEVPAQDDELTWKRLQEQFGGCYLEPPSIRRQFPRTFSWYGPLAIQALAETSTDGAYAGEERSPNNIRFIHAPIDDLTVPNSEPLWSLLVDLLEIISQKAAGAAEEEEEKNNKHDHGAIYMHCWGGRGRAGLVGACLVSLIWPEWTSDHILDVVQAGYSSRAGANHMPLALSRSPQTEEQRNFVRNFVRKQNLRANHPRR